jgi:hypothetical protein
MRVAILLGLAWLVSCRSTAPVIEPPTADANPSPDSSVLAAEAGRAPDDSSPAPPDLAALDAAPPIACGDCPLCRCNGGPCPDPVPPAGVLPEVSDCSPADSPREDECACQGKACPADQRCVRARTDPVPGLGGPEGLTNLCRAPCAAATDCGAGRECRPDPDGVYTCQRRQCRTDADCTADACGRCAPSWKPGHIREIQLPYVHRCVYAGRCRPGSCAGCASAAEGNADLHTCGP